MAKKKTEKQIQITPQMQNEFNRYANVLDGNVGTSTFGKMSDAEFNTMYNQAKAQTGYGKMSDDEFNKMYSQATNSVPQNNTIPTLDDLISNPTLKSKEDTYKTDYSQAISDLQNALNGNDLSDGQRNAYNEFLGGLNTLQEEINAHNNKVAKTSQIRSQNPISKKEEQKKVDTSYRDREIAKSVEATKRGKVDTSYRDREIAKSVQATQKYNDSLQARGYSLEPREIEVQNPAYFGYQPSTMQFGELQKGATPTPAETAIPQVDLEQLARNKAQRDTIAKDKEKNQAREWVRAKEESANGNNEKLIAKLDELATTKNISDADKKELDNLYEKYYGEYGGRTKDTGSQYSLNQFNQEEKYNQAVASGELDPELYASIERAHNNHSIVGGMKDFIGNVGAKVIRPIVNTLAIGENVLSDNTNLQDIANELTNYQAESMQMHPVSSIAGQIGAGMAQYGLANQVAQNIFGELNPLQNILVGQGIDEILDTAPELTSNALAGKYKDENGDFEGGEFAKDFLINNGLNLAGNVVGEIPGIKDSIAKKTARKNVNFAPGEYKNALREGTISRQEIVQKSSPTFQKILTNLENNEDIDLKELMDTPEVKYAEAYLKRGSSILDGTYESSKRKKLHKQIIDDYSSRGSARVDSNGKTVYDGPVDRNRTVIFVTGLPASGKSSTLANPLSEYFHARILDSDDIKEMLPEFNNGLGANYVHKESKKILTPIQIKAIEDGENLVIPIVGGDDYQDLVDKIKIFSDNPTGKYSVIVCQNDLPSNKAIGRAMSRYLTHGRYIPPDVLMGYANTPQENFLRLIREGEKDGIQLSGYARVSNDVAEGQTANLIESEGLLKGVLGNTEGSGQRGDRGLEEILRDEINLPSNITSGNVNNVIPALDNTNITNSNVISDNIPKVENEIKNYNGDVGTPKDMPQYERGKVSKTRTNTLENSGINTKEELESEYLDPNKFKYEDETESMQMERAISDIINDPKGEYEKVMSKTMDTGSEDDVNKLFIFYNEAVKVARESDNPEAWKEASKIYKQIQELGTDRSKGLQAFAKFSRNTKEGIMTDGLRDIRRELEKEMGDSVAKETVDKILDNELKNLDDLLSKAMDAGFETREGKKILAQFGKICDKYTPKTYRGKLQTILMDNMLGNFRTLISRNAGGNVGYNALEFAKQPITALYDKVLSKKTGARFRTGWSKDKIVSSLNGFKNGFLDEIDDVRSGLHTAKDGESTLPKAIDLNRHTWSENHASNGSVVYNKLGLNKNESVNKFMDASGKVANKIDDLVKHGLSMGDRPFYEAAYNQRLSELTDLRSRGLLSADLMSLSDEEFNVIAELSAKMDGLSSTYQDDSAIAEALSLFKEGLGKVSEEFTGFNWLAQLSTPFVKTPGNIIDKAIDYSPLGFVKRYGEVISDKVRGRDFNQQRFVDEAGRNILGTALVGGGYALAKNGIVNGAYDEDADVKNAQKNSGMIEYGLNLPNNYNMDMSWIPVLGTDAIIGSAINDSLKNNPDATLGEAVENGATAMLNTLLSQSSTQGLQRVFGGTNSYGSSGWGDNIKSTIESGLGQFVPSLSRQIANSTDQYQREISDGDRSYEMNNILSGIPVIREAKLQPKVDNEGNLVLQNQGRGLGSRLAENMLFPGTLKQVEQSPLDEEAMRIYNADETKGEKKQFATTPSRKDIATDDYVPTDEDYRRYKEDVGTTKKELGDLLLNNPDYQKLNDVQKSEILSSMYSKASMASKTKFKPEYTTDDKTATDIAEGKYDDAISKLIDSQTVSKAIQNKEEDMSEADGALSYLKKEDKTEEEKGKILYNNLKSNKTTVGLVENGESYEAKDGKSYSGYEGVYHFYNDKSELDENGEISEETQQKKALVEELNDLGVSSTSADKLYNRAKGKIPTLTTEQFAETFNKMNSDGNSSIKQDEIFAYFKKYNVSQSQANTLWDAYGDWKTVPVLEDGVWKAKKQN